MTSKNSSQALFYCILLALQFGLQPLLVTRFTSPGISKISLVIGTEIGKILLSITSILSEPEASRKKIFGSWTLSRSLKLAALPATLYAIQNLSIQYSYMYLDSMSFNLLSQTKVTTIDSIIYVNT